MALINADETRINAERVRLGSKLGFAYKFIG